MLRALGVALALFLEDLDPIVVHVLACTAGEIAEYLAVKASGQPFTVLWRHSATTPGGILDGREINFGILSDTQPRMKMTKGVTAA